MKMVINKQEWDYPTVMKSLTKVLAGTHDERDIRLIQGAIFEGFSASTQVRLLQKAVKRAHEEHKKTLDVMEKV